VAETPELSVVVPAFDEAARLPGTLDRVIDYLRNEIADFEILVVDDGSRDETAHIAGEILSDVAGGSVMSLPHNRGKGAACRAGVRSARGRRILITDADLSTPIEEERVLRRALEEGADIAIGSRAHPEANITRRQSRLRESAGQGFNLLLRMLRLTDLSDTQCGFKMFSHEAARLFERARIDGFLFDVEILFLARRAGLNVVEIPVEWHNDPDSRVHLLRHLPEVLGDLLRIRLGL
jgi:dolichyl-phosphate beta-glucosyltransferase